MQVIRTLLWVTLTAILVAFIAMNWTKVPVNFWPLTGGNYVHFEWPVGVVALVFFLFGAVPMWLVHRAAQWRLKRRIHSLENTMLAVGASPSPAMPEASPSIEPELAAPSLAPGSSA
ncbi:lipopolysaccharide assembly protein LapA domain-containing protein [Novosphingobium sp. M1R2S20]|uniref:Lipopolysaccharide assembly protein LapA domain-containing protein n=1 Tax=Novosphingobium rhizovicinum TaxID=3228928 RepID=A0ABV3REK0_9SPHN